MSLTHMATRSMPTVSWRPVKKAIFSLVPTPSVEPTKTGWRMVSVFKENSPPNPPISPMTPGVLVAFTNGLMAEMNRSPLSMSTPAPA